MDTVQAEAAEQKALISWYNAAKEVRASGFDWHVLEIGDALCSVSSSEPSILVNRVFGVGSKGGPDVEQLKDIRALYSEAGVERFFLHVIPGKADPAALEAAGFENYRGWMKFIRSTDDRPKPRSDLEVREIGPEHADEFARIAGSAFDFLPSSFPTVAKVVGARGYRCFMTFDGDKPAGTGVVYVDGESGVFDFGATDPGFRRRGGQSAVLAARVACAAEMGCRNLYTMTGEAVPDDPQHSYSNILRAGFEEAYLRENWVPAT